MRLKAMELKRKALKTFVDKAFRAFYEPEQYGL
jgi:hypothetical protein